MAIKDDIKTVKEMISMADTTIETANSLLSDKISSYGLNDLIIQRLNIPNTKEISEYTDNDIDKILVSIDANKEETYIDALRKKYEELDNNNPDSEDYKTFYDYKKEIFLDIKGDLVNIRNIYKEKENLITEINKISEDYFNYKHSDEYKEKRNAYIEKLKQDIEATSDSSEKNKLTKMLDALTNEESIDFLFERVNKLGDKEIKNIKDIFFNNKRSELVMDRFRSRLPRFGYSKDIYKIFFNIEEKFLPEEYHVYNNIFLFHVTRYIAYIDPDNKVDSLHASIILSKLYNLIYHKFSSEELENDFINKIKEFDDRFKEYKDYFEENNVTAPSHPSRKEKDKEYDERKRMLIITSLQNAGMEDIDTTMETDELENLLLEYTKPHEEVVDEVEETVDIKEVSEEDITEESIEKEAEPITKPLEEIVSQVGEETTISSEEADIEAENITEEAIEESNEEEVEDEELPDIDIVVNPADYYNDLDLAKKYILKFIKDNNYNVTVEDINNRFKVYVDLYGDFYGNLKSDTEYTLFGKNSDIVEDNIPEEQVLRLLNVNALNKITFDISTKE